jgi:UDP-glucose 4-epimerase
MCFLVTGLGFIGSHICVELLQLGHSVIAIDKQDKLETLEKIRKIVPNLVFLKINITDKDKLNHLFRLYNITHVIHTAGLKSVSESILYPLDYYYNNVYGTMCLLEIMKIWNCTNLIFSSSATVYGENTYPVDESAPTGCNITNPYGKTKYIIEEMLKDVRQDMNIVILRYFNPVSHSHDLKESGEGTNLFPILVKTAKNGTMLKIYGNQHDTQDGTCVRDFIHVVDLAQAHIAALKIVNKGVHIYNVGTGNGVSVSEFIKCFEETNNVKINYEFVSPRPGDLSVAYAKVDKIKKELKWKATKTLQDICRDGWVGENFTTQ